MILQIYLFYIDILPAVSTSNFAKTIFTLLLTTLKFITTPANPLSNLYSKITFTVSVTLAPIFNCSNVAKFPMPLNFLHCLS